MQLLDVISLINEIWLSLGEFLHKNWGNRGQLNISISIENIKNQCQEGRKTFIIIVSL